LFIYVVAIPIGIYTAVKQYSLGDYFFTIIGFLGLAIPNFLLALVLMFASYSIFDISIGGLFSPEFQDAPWGLAKIKDLIDHMWVPVIVLGTAGTAGTIRIMRGVLLDELGKDYVRTARAKGLNERKVIITHPVRIALNPIVSLIGFQFPALISGAAITSVVLNLPTTGPLLLQALETQDMYLAGSLLFLLSILTVIGLFVSDMILAAIDPRIKFEQQAQI
jgi:peptide/nickel transport system permease protein